MIDAIRLARARCLRALLGIALLSCPAAALAHGGEIHEGQPWWTMWQFSPEILFGLLFADWIYGRGVARGAAPSRWRAAAFYGGLVALAAALLSPIEPLADHVFAIHQLEHMLLRTIGPMLILIGAPQAALMRGLPDWLRRPVVQPAINSPGLRSVFGFFSRPAVATFLFLFATFFWMVPRWHDVAILNEPIHYLWHVSLLVSGLFFFSVLFDPRPAPAGARLGIRLAMFFLAAMGNILLGAFLSFKTHQLYHAYDVMGRLWGIGALSDEQIGGLTMWIPGTMMFAASAIYVLYRWGSEEGRTHERRQRLGTAAIHAADARAAAARNNRMLAVGLGSFAAMVLAIAVAASALYEHELSTDPMTGGVVQANTPL
jgi:putative membrane protein